MANCNDNKNPLQRNGTSQPERLLPSLSPSSAPVMDKDPLQWMVWGSRLSRQIRYYNSSNSANTGDSMEPFFASDIAARLAMLATHRLDIIPDFVREQLLILYENSNSSKTALLRKTFTSLFDVLLGYIQSVDSVHLQLLQFEQRQPGMLTGIDFPFQLRNHMETRLLSVLQRSIAYYKAARTNSLTDVTIAEAIEVFNQPISTADAILSAGLSKMWWSSSATWQDFVDNTAEEASIFGMAATVSGKIQHASHHNFFTGLLDEISASAAFLVSLAKEEVKKLLDQWPNHDPQYALFLAWLYLLENARDGMNLLTSRHLEFYYERVLQLKRSLPVADTAFLALELNKAVNKTELLKVTAFIGGKDSAGKEIVYHATRNTVLNKASVERLQSLYLADGNDKIGVTSQSGLLFASPIANSEDGLGAKLDSPLGEWHPFFNKTYDNGELVSINMPKAQVGFAISSHYLRLKEGKRKITLRLDVNNESLLIGKRVAVSITTEKEWLSIGTLQFTSGTLNNGVGNAAVLSFTVAADKPAITGYVTKTHGHRFDTTEPVITLLLPNDLANASAYKQMLSLTLNRADIEIQVGELTGSYNNEGLKDLQLQNDAGVVNASKPFQPFGNEPTKGNALIIGSDELFYKPNARVQLNLEWKDLPEKWDSIQTEFENTSDYQSLNTTNGSDYCPWMELQYLQQGKWNTLQSNLNLFPLSPSPNNKPLAKTVIPAGSTLSGNLFLKADNPYQPYSPSVNRGFLRLQLRHDFGHRNYRNKLGHYLIEKGKSNPNVTEPAAPYNPTLASLTISYNAKCTLMPAAANQPMQWWHVAPFGEAKVAGAGLSLMAPLTQVTSHDKAQASLFIGLSGVGGNETVSLLFQLMEGSENPLQAKPPVHIQWQYLSQNVWVPFEEGNVDDGTDQLIRSGIIHFALPSAVSSTNSIMQPGLVWLRAQVQEAVDAVCKIIGIHANAIAVRRQLQQGSSVQSFMQPNGTISKMQQPDGMVKKVVQPYSSFGGKPLESGDAYYTRVSERLRHKDRAITIWDYERLVLQEFPEIYKVKCLNHTKLSGSIAEGNLEYNEVAPGHVTIITIPNLQQRNDADPLKPYTRKSTLDAIEKFLRSRISCHVQLTAAQPQFEEIRLAAKVKLLDGYDDLVYYQQQLQEALTAYLSPWAYGHQGQPSFGGSIHKSVLIDFLEELPYVDFITDVQLFHTPGEDGIESADVEEAVASTARSVLVSAPAKKHAFTMLSAASQPNQKMNCQDA